MVCDDQVPLRATSQQREYEGAEEDQGAERWNYAEQSADVLFRDAEALAPLQSSVEAVGGQQATQHDKGICVQGGSTSNHRPRLANGQRHFRSVRVRLEEQGH